MVRFNSNSTTHMKIPPDSSAMDLSRQPQRDPEWIKHDKPVIILTGVFKPSELIDIDYGHICSTKLSHIGIDNIKNFMVWSDKPVRKTEDVDDAHETIYLLNDPCILSHLEVGYLHDDPMRVYHWFKANISLETAKEIAELLDTVLTNSLDHL